MKRTGTTRFIGRYYHALEQKGRLSIPAVFRQILGDSAVITRGLDGCLFLFPYKNWEKISQQAANMPLTKKQSRAWVRLLANNAADVLFDDLGRIMVPEHLRTFGKLAKAVVIVGSLNYVEIWDQETYHHYLKSIENQAEAIAETLTPDSEVN